MEQFLANLITTNPLIIFVIVAITQAIKQIIPQESYKYLDLVNIILGAILSGVLGSWVVEAILNGIVIGLAAGKLYDRIVGLFEHDQFIDI